LTATVVVVLVVFLVFLTVALAVVFGAPFGAGFASAVEVDGASPLSEFGHANAEADDSENSATRASFFMAEAYALDPARAISIPRRYPAAMHRSRLAGFIMDCKTDDLDGAAAFWSAALGLDTLGPEDNYVRLDGSSRDMVIEVQRVEHPSRLHLDIETDDIEAEVARLVKLGAREVERIKTWVVLEAPSGQRFCVVRAKVDLDGRAGARAY
jgi:hypothetical protein